MPAPDLVSLGECMVELSRHADGRFSLAYGGDTFNTAVYASRLGLRVAYGTALGDDPYSDAILALATREGVDVSAIAREAGRVPGLYIIETDASGERRFFYWRDTSPARRLFDIDNPALSARCTAARCLYFSGITLSLYSPTGLDRLESVLRAARQRGAEVAFDGNYRPRGWGGDVAKARATMARFLPLATIALPTFDDEQALWGDREPGETLERLAGHGIGEIVVKNGREGVQALVAGAAAGVPVPEAITPLDTTAAGDSFNAGYLACRLRGEDWRAAARFGHRVAGRVISHRGAIIPSDAMNGLV